MKRIYLVGFRGTGFRDAKFRNEPALVRAGHVGVSFEGYEESILGFHPTSAAIEAIGGEDAAIEWLKRGEKLDGTLQEDYSIFVRAYELVKTGARTTVWELVIELPDDEFEQIRRDALEWYNDKRVLAYAFPSENLKPDQDNCATFPRHLGLPLLDPIGQIRDYVRILEEQGQVWKVKGN